MSQRSTILVTGADRGIGAALCHESLARGDAVIAACLEDSADLRAAGARVETGVDVTSDAAVAALAERLAGTRLDVLLNNAGLFRATDWPKLDFADFRTQYEVNALGPLRVVQALRSCLHPGAKVGIVTSRVGSLGENGLGGLYGYRMSKAAGNMAGLCLARELAPAGIAVVCLHPGSVRTDMTKVLGESAVAGSMIDPAEAARGLLARIDELTLETTGTFRHANGMELPW